MDISNVFNVPTVLTESKFRNKSKKEEEDFLGTSLPNPSEDYKTVKNIEGKKQKSIVDLAKGIIVNDEQTC